MQFFSQISHELKTPVTVIRASIENLKEGIPKGNEERQLLMILIDNAVKYSNSGTTIRMSLNCEEKCLMVQDEGCGISQESILHIFDIHYREKSKDVEGNGLGLAIAKQIAIRHGFRIEVQSEENKGSTFYLYM